MRLNIGLSSGSQKQGFNNAPELFQCYSVYHYSIDYNTIRVSS